MPSLKEIWLGSSPSLSKKPTGTPEQQQFGQDLISQLMQMMQSGGSYGQSQDYLGGLFGQDAFNQFAQPYNQQFEQQVLPGIAERFAGFGNSSGALSSSGFGQALSGGASDFQSKLAQLFSQLQMQGANQLGNQFNQQAQLGLGYQPFAYHQKQGSTGAGIQFMNSLAGGASGAAGM